MWISISEVQALAGCAIDDDLDGWPEIALTNVVRMPLVWGLGIEPGRSSWSGG
jgi:hypothetical protein